MKLCNGIQLSPFKGQAQQWHWGCNDCRRMLYSSSRPSPPPLRWTDHCRDRVPYGAVQEAA